ncbi:MAG: MBL fold metallo-hydrolase [Bacilli bacterium]|nr:MBL fold metallo-hydrolase [Bacilli bacterium]
MFFNVIASGSKGNATVIVENNTRILIDLGISLCRLEEGLKEINLCTKDIDAAFFTHNHSDHIKGIKFLSPKKMYGLQGTLPSSLSNIINLDKEIKIKDLTIIPFNTSHDAINPCGFVIKSKNEKLVYMTDTGVFLKDSLDILKDPDYLIIESNHDIKMLMETNRTMELKQRILSDHGHLCNEDSAFATLDIIGQNIKEIVLAHLSEEANTPERALKAYNEVFAFKGFDFNKYKIRCANQWVSLLGGNYEN